MSVLVRTGEASKTLNLDLAVGLWKVVVAMGDSLRVSRRDAVLEKACSRLCDGISANLQFRWAATWPEVAIPRLTMAATPRNWQFPHFQQPFLKATRSDQKFLHRIRGKKEKRSSNSIVCLARAKDQVELCSSRDVFNNRHVKFGRVFMHRAVAFSVLSKHSLPCLPAESALTVPAVRMDEHEMAEVEVVLTAAARCQSLSSSAVNQNKRFMRTG